MRFVKGVCTMRDEEASVMPPGYGSSPSMHHGSDNSEQLYFTRFEQFMLWFERSTIFQPRGCLCCRRRRYCGSRRREDRSAEIEGHALLSLSSHFPSCCCCCCCCCHSLLRCALNNLQPWEAFALLSAAPSRLRQPANAAL